MKSWQVDISNSKLSILFEHIDMVFGLLLKLNLNGVIVSLYILRYVQCWTADRKQMTDFTNIFGGFILLGVSNGYMRL